MVVSELVIAIENLVKATIALAQPTFIKKMPFKAISSSTVPEAVKIQSGWDYVTGTGTNFVDKTITFPEAMTAVDNVVVGALGLLSGSNPTAIGSLNVGFSGNIVYMHAYNITNTGFTLRATLDSSATLSSSLRVGFSWIAIGH